MNRVYEFGLDTAGSGSAPIAGFLEDVMSLRALGIS